MTKIRIDDYPFCIPGRDPVHTERCLREMFHVLKDCGVDYYFGAIPWHMDEHWLDVADSCMGANGHLVMHGFTHLHERWGQGLVDSLVATGGEFSGMSKYECQWLYDEAHETLSMSERYDADHFIAPFNNYTQELVDALRERGVKYLHTCDKEFNQYGYADMEYGAIVPVIAHNQKDYNFAKRALASIQKTPSPWVTLHWYYEFRHFGDGWLTDLRNLIKECRK